MGARRMIATGRTRTQLDEYVEVYGPCMVSFVPTDDEAKDTQGFVQDAGMAVLMGVVQANIEIPYAHITLNNITIMGKLMLEEINEVIERSAANSGPFNSTIVVP
ncbi:hypothetical protein BGZ93_008391 [Podila epicladia]|nr:hypothetical protein BGZ93_008391 [Podila epicladia]